MPYKFQPHEGTLQGYSDSSYSNNLGHIPFGEKASSNDRSSLLGAFGPPQHKNFKDNELVLFSGSGIDGRFAAIGTDGLGLVEPESFSERCSSINDDRGGPHY